MLIDWISCLFLSIVLFVRSVVFFYRYRYILTDKFNTRFCFILVLFVLSMCFLLIRSTFIFTLLGWDGLGIVSYLLVTYYYSKSSLNSGLVTVLTNRFGDINFLILIALLINNYRWSYKTIFLNDNIIILLFALLIRTKSAQFPFSAWLPLAIAAPTPVSSLVHSSTLVTAGVYLAYRNLRLLNFNLIFYLSSSTLIISRYLALWENDFKKIIALSTLRQIALLLFSIILYSNLLSFFHIIRHALFKRILFLSRGNVLHSIFSVQDTRYITNWSSTKKLTFIIFLIGNLCLIGAPFLCGFFSKDLLYENSLNELVIFSIIIIRVGLTRIYSAKIVYKIVRETKLYFFVRKDRKDSTLPLIALFIRSIIFGFFIWWFQINLKCNMLVFGVKKYILLILVVLSSFIILSIGHVQMFIMKIIGLHSISTKLFSLFINYFKFYLHLDYGYTQVWTVKNFIYQWRIRLGSSYMIKPLFIVLILLYIILL